MNKKQLKKEIAEFKQTQKAPEYCNLDFTIVLSQPEHAGNIGSIRVSASSTSGVRLSG